ncbi:protein of unknown function [Desulfovibrio sp. 86]|nr:protein of unknown function [Desulfovibrio sp. 86]
MHMDLLIVCRIQQNRASGVTPASNPDKGPDADPDAGPDADHDAGQTAGALSGCPVRGKAILSICCWQ